MYMGIFWWGGGRGAREEKGEGRDVHTFVHCLRPMCVSSPA